MLMLGNKYSDVVDTHTERNLYYNHHFIIHQPQHYLHSNEIYHHELTTVLKQNFTHTLYPSHNAHLNPFCPICLKFVNKQSKFLGYFSAIFGKTYLAHDECLKKEESNCLNTILGEINHAKLSIIGSINDARSFCFGQKQYYLQMQILHALTNKSYFTLKNKIQSNGSSIVWSFNKYHQPSQCFPNIIAFPYPDFQIQITSSKLSQKNKSKHKAFVNLQKLKIQGDKLVKISTQEFDLIIKVINDEKTKLTTIDEMNFKYNHPINIQFPLIELIKLQLKISNNDSDEDAPYQNSRENSSITELLNQNTPETSTIKSNSLYDNKNSYLSEVPPSFQKQKVDLNKLISTQKLSQYVKNNIQSRHFQAYLSEINNEQLTQILTALQSQFCELVTHQYANYMMQKLFTLCNPSQRMFILERIANNIPMIAKNKQGTHTLQSLVSLLTHPQEFTIVVQSIKNSLYQLSEHPNATHFLQKIITSFPITYTFSFFSLVSQHFLAFAVNKNAMCVIKHMIKKIKELQDIHNTNIPFNHMEEIKKRFIHSTAINIDRIIQDSYGNYVVQFCYQFFGFERCIRITEMILQRFSQFSIQKYSGSVILKCVDTYWVNKDTVEKLKYSLNANSILDMYRNKEGNKILLTIMQKYDNTAIRQKIYSQVVTAQPTKFLHERWGVALGSRTGTVGTNWSSFSDAVKPSLGKKKKNHIIQ